LAKSVEVVTKGRETCGYALTSEAEGYHSGLLPLAAGTQYKFRLNGTDLVPDPASRFQPEGPFGWSEVINPQFPWTDRNWEGIKPGREVIYEMHIGTFTSEGSFAAAQRELEELGKIGITLVELMPVADFPGEFGWGYDGVNLFAPCRLYGRPEDFRRFVDTAHAVGVGVILDVVYNHLGPSGNFLAAFSDTYFNPRRPTEWGDSINFDAEGNGPVREFFLTNVAYWMSEFHLDGLRLDATQSIHDESEPHILTEIGRVARANATMRHTSLMAENEPQDSTLVAPREARGHALDSMWNDDFHHTAVVALTGRREAYYHDYLGTAQELLSAAKYGFLYQGQYYAWQKQNRGRAALRCEPKHFITYLENHDQVANTSYGLRLHQMTSPARWRAMTAFWLLCFEKPLLFQGQEFGSSAPFLFFADHAKDLAEKVRVGRADFLSQFQGIAASHPKSFLAVPDDRLTFSRCKLDHSERTRNAAAYALHEDLLRLRREDPVFSGGSKAGLDGSILSAHAFLVRLFGADEQDRLLLVNLGAELRYASIAEPLFAPPQDADWQMTFSSEDVRYGGAGGPQPNSGGSWTVTAESTTVFEARKR
jgi:maltooligosyltrehalose trehalohydrolase